MDKKSIIDLLPSQIPLEKYIVVEKKFDPDPKKSAYGITVLFVYLYLSLPIDSLQECT